MRTRVEITGTLRAEAPIHVGGGDRGALVDAPVLIDGAGRPLIPGTSLAGVLRSALGGGDDLWGSEPPTGGARDASVPSRVTVFDAFKLGDDARVADDFVVDHVAIDRFSGTAVDRRLFSRAYLPAGTDFRCRILVEGGTGGGVSGGVDRAVDEAQAIARLLVAGGISVGANTANGAGRVRLRNPQLKRFGIDARNLVTALTGGETLAVDLAGGAEDAPAPGVVRFTIPFSARGPLYSGVKIDGSPADMIPLTRKDADGSVRLVLPGSSVKGALRAHAERIERTAAGTDVAAADDFDDQLASAPMAGLLFGTPPKAEGKDGRKGVMVVRDVTSSASFDADAWQGLFQVSDDQEMLGRIDALNKMTGEPAVGPGGGSGEGRGGPGRLRLELVTRNSIDRFTGAVVDGALFTVLEARADFDPMVVDFDLRALYRRLGDAASADRIIAALTLLMLVLRDVADGLVTFGAHGNRGAGGIDVDRSSILVEFGDTTRMAGLLSGEEAQRVSSLLNRVAGDDKGRGRSLAGIVDDAELAAELSQAWQTVVDDGAKSNRASTDGARVADEYGIDEGRRI